MLSEELCILSSCFLSPMSKNSVLEELRVRRLAVYQFMLILVIFGKCLIGLPVVVVNYVYQFNYCLLDKRGLRNIGKECPQRGGG